MTQKLGLPCDICPSSWVWAAGRLGSHQELSNSVPKEIGSRGTKRSSHPSVKVSWASTRNPFMSNIITLFLWGCIPIELEYLEFEMIENHRNSAGDFSHHSQPSSAPYQRLTVQPFDQISSTPTDSPARCVELNIRCTVSQFGTCCCKTVGIQSSPNGRSLSAAATGLRNSLHHHLSSWGVQKLDA